MHDHSSPNSPAGDSPHLPLIALTGNPNSGKTTLFNHLTGSNQKVANYSGVTVELREGIIRHGDARYRLLDLPGLYSLSAVSPDEEVARDLVVHGIGAAGRPDLIVQVVDGGRLERSLLLTMQLVEQGIPVVIAFNMFDEVKRRGLLLDLKRFSALIGIPVIPTVGNRGEGMTELTEAIARTLYYGSDEGLHVVFDASTEKALEEVTAICREGGASVSRGLAIGLLTGEISAGRNLTGTVVQRVKAVAAAKKPDIGGGWAEAITHARYAAISKLLAYSSGPGTSSHVDKTVALDHIFLHRVWGIPIFLAMLFLLFQVTFTLGAYPMEWIDVLVGWTGDLVKSIVPGLFGKVIADGFIAGAGMILVFLPNILILMMGIHLLEDSGYLARAAFLMDRVMRTMGLHGRAFIPLLMGFGCNVPALMGSRVLESRRDRLVTMLTIPFMSCSARLPVYVMITAAFFPDNAGLVIFCLYVFGSIAAVVLGKLLNRTILKGKAAPFLLELPPYRWPTSRTTVNLLKFTSTTFLKRIGGVTALFAVMIWFLINFPRPEAGQETEGYQENSYIYQFGRVLEPVFEPLGFTVPMDVALVSGFVAKEVVVATMGVLFTGSSESSEESLVEQLRRQIPGQASAMAFLVFVLLYTPCLTTVVTLQKETKRWYWTTFSLVYQTAFAWGAAWVVYRLWALGFGH